MYPSLWIPLLLFGVIIFLLALRTYMVIRAPRIRRMLLESPIFSPTEGIPCADAENVEFQTADGLTLRGSYLKTPCGSPAALVVFCHEFLADRWSGFSYWESLLSDGFDVFTFDFRNHGTSDCDPAYTPHHWVTQHDVNDVMAALDYLDHRQDSCSLPIGLFGISRGGGAAIAAAAEDPTVRALVTDGAFATHGTVLNYMRKWVVLYSDNRILHRLPDWYYSFIRDRVLAGIGREFNCRFPKLERALRRISPRPIFMIHGGRDSYIRPSIAREFFEHARGAKEFWVVKGARHNACLEQAGEEYQGRVRSFFRTHLTVARSMQEATV